MGLYVAPRIPSEKLHNARASYAGDVEAEDVLALYDATLIGNAKDGAVLTDDRLVFQNHGMDPVHVVAYDDVVRVDQKRRLLGGRRVSLQVNRGRATFDLMLDFSGRPDAAEYVARFLKEAMLHPGGGPASSPGTAPSDRERVHAALASLHDEGVLPRRTMEAMLAAFNEASNGGDTTT